MYRSGKGVTQDYDKAMKYFLESANQRHSSAQYAIGIPILFKITWINHLFE